MVHNNYNTTFCVRSKTLKVLQQNSTHDFSPGARYLIAASLISSSLFLKLSFYSTQYLVSHKHEVSYAKYYITIKALTDTELF